MYIHSTCTSFKCFIERKLFICWSSDWEKASSGCTCNMQHQAAAAVSMFSIMTIVNQLHICKLQINRLYVKPITLYFLVFSECILLLSADLSMAADNGHCFHYRVGPPSLRLPAVQNHQDWGGQAVWRQAGELPGLCWVLDFSGTSCLLSVKLVISVGGDQHDQ